MRRWITSILLLSLVYASMIDISYGIEKIDCDRYVSKCETNKSHFVNYGLDIMKDDNGIITQVIEYRGYSLLNTCFSESDFFVRRVYFSFASYFTNF